MEGRGPSSSNTKGSSQNHRYTNNKNKLTKLYFDATITIRKPLSLRVGEGIREVGGMTRGMAWEGEKKGKKEK